MDGVKVIRISARKIIFLK